MLQVVEFVCTIGDAEDDLEFDTRMANAPFEQPNGIPMAQMMRMLRRLSLPAEVTHPHSDHLQAVGCGVVLSKKLSKELSDRVQTLWTRNKIYRTEGPGRITGEKASTAREYDTSNVASSSRLEDVVRPDDVVLKDVFPGCGGCWIPRKVNNNVHSGGGPEEIIQAPHVPNAAVDDTRCRNTVEAAQIVSFSQTFDERSSDSACGAGNEHFQLGPFLIPSLKSWLIR